MVSFLDHGDDVVCLPQVTAVGVLELAAMGIRSIICNRPDDETEAVPSTHIAAAAEVAGLKFKYLPVTMATISMRDGADFVRLLEELPKPVAAYCRTGRRSAALWVLGRAPLLGIEATLKAARDKGITLDGLAPLPPGEWTDGSSSTDPA
jgi:sulfide:quinone oxidoreductase